MAQNIKAFTGAEIADGLTELAELFRSEPKLAASRFFPELGLDISMIANSPEGVLELGEKLGVKAADERTTHSRYTKIKLRTGVDRGEHVHDASRRAVIFSVTAIS